MIIVMLGILAHARDKFIFGIFGAEFLLLLLFFSDAMAAVRVCVAVIVAAQCAWAQETCHTNGKDLCKCTTDSGITLDLRKVGLPYP